MAHIMEIIPSLSFKQGLPVVVENGMYGSLLESTGFNTINEMLEPLGDHEKLYLFDIDGIESNKIQSEVIRRLGARKELWADIGSRDLDTIIDAYVIGADRVVVSTKRMPSFQLLKDAVDMSDRIVFTIDHKNGIISPDKSIRSMKVYDVIEEAVDIGIDTVVLLDHSKEHFDLDIISSPEGDHSLFIGGRGLNEVNEFPDIVKGLILSYQEVLERRKPD